MNIFMTVYEILIIVSLWNMTLILHLCLVHTYNVNNNRDICIKILLCLFLFKRNILFSFGYMLFIQKNRL